MTRSYKQIALTIALIIGAFAAQAQQAIKVQPAIVGNQQTLPQAQIGQWQAQHATSICTAIATRLAGAGVDAHDIQSIVYKPQLTRETTYVDSTDRYKPDSTHVSYRYDAAGNQTRRASLNYRTQDSSSLVTYLYDQFGNDTTTVFYLRRSGAWVPFFRSVNRYDSSNRFTYTALDDYVASTGGFRLSSGYRYTYTTDSINRVIETIGEGFDFTVGTWALETRVTYEFDLPTGGYATENNFETDPSGNWVPLYRLTNFIWHDYAAFQDSTYDKEDYTSGAYLPIQHYLTTWGANGSYVRTTQDLRSGPTPQNQFQLRQINTITAAGSEFKSQYFAWNGSTQAWDQTDERSTQFDADNLPTLTYALAISGGAADTTSATRNLYDRNGQGRLTRRLQFVFSTNTGRSILQYRTVYEELIGITSATPRPTAVLASYPNPASSTLMLPALSALPVAQVQILDVAGHQVALRTALAGRLSVAGLAPGIYQIRAQTATGSAAGRVVVQ